MVFRIARIKFQGVEALIFETNGIECLHDKIFLVNKDMSNVACSTSVIDNLGLFWRIDGVVKSWLGAFFLRQCLLLLALHSALRANRLSVA